MKVSIVSALKLLELMNVATGILNYSALMWALDGMCHTRNLRTP